MANEAKPEKLTVWEAIKDLGWFPVLFAVVVGGPSILAILEQVFVNHELVPALQWIVDGYNRIMAVLGAVVEPLVQPAINWVNATFGWSLQLDPIWRPAFALFMIWGMATVRANTTSTVTDRATYFLWWTFLAALFAMNQGFFPSHAVLGLSVFSVTVIWSGVHDTVKGVNLGRHYLARRGLTLLGGFVAAGMILAADFGLKALGVG